MNRLQFDRQFPGPVLGIDEVGVGCIAGPVVACGVVLPEDRTLLQLLEDLNARDSKQMTEYVRHQVFDAMVEHGVWFVTVQAPPEIFKTKNMTQVLDGLFLRIVSTALKQPGFGTCIIDGSQDRNLAGRHFKAIPKADDKSLAVACASIAAKTYRDNLMRDLHEKYPHYGWDTNKGYPTKKHKDGVLRRGVVEGVHRTSIKGVKKLIAARGELPPASFGVSASDRASLSRAVSKRLLRGSGRFH